MAEAMKHDPGGLLASQTQPTPHAERTDPLLLIGQVPGRGGVRVLSNMVPAVIDVWWRQWRHINSVRLAR